MRLYQGTEVSGVETREGNPSIPATASLQTPYPNPFNPVITVPFTLSGRDGVDLSIYDLRGRWIYRLAEGIYPAGEHRVIWRGQDDRGRYFPSGTYFLRLRAGGRTLDTVKINLAR